MVTADELAQMAAAAERMLHDSITVERVSTAADGFGGETRTWGPVATVAGRLGPYGRNELLFIGDQLAGRIGWVVTVPVDTDVAAGDRILVDDRTLEVIAVPRRTFATALRVMTVEVS